MSLSAAKPAQGASRFRRLAVNILVLVVSSIGCVLLLELAVRQLFPYFHPSAQVPFRSIGNGVVTGPPSSTRRHATPKRDFDLPLHFNAYGFRDAKDLRDSKESDWFVVGDSFTFGWGVTEGERYSNVVQNKLQTNGSATRVYNIAIPDNIIGYQRLVKYAEGCGATVGHLIVGLCMENDLWDYREGQSAWDGPSQYLPRTPRKAAIRSWFKNHSAFYNGLAFWLQGTEAGRKLFQKIGVARNIEQLTNSNPFDEGVLQSTRKELLKLVAGRNATVLIIPSRRLWHGANMETENRVHQRFVEILREAQVRVVDLKPALEQSGSPLSHYFVSDPHWNARGHQLAAEHLFKAIVEH